MWIFPAPTSNSSSLSAPAAGDSISASDWRFPLLARSATWRSKPSPARRWSDRWKRHGWMQHLCGRICDPSEAASGVARWTGSLAAIRASRSVSQADSEAWMIPDISGRSFAEISGSSDQRGASSRTSPTICASDSTKSPEIYTRWATTLQQVCSARRKSGHRTDGNGCSSWPSPAAADGERGSQTYMRGNLTLRGAAISQWPTPIVNDAQGSTHCYSNGDHTKIALKLPGAVQQSTKAWSTPRSSDAEKGGPHQAFSAGGTPLPSQAVSWATPTQRDWKDGTDASQNAPTNSLLGRQAPRMMPAGDGSLTAGPTPRLQLNPMFVEWLMGWPLGWTDCGYWATGSSPSKPLTRSSRSRGILPSTAINDDDPFADLRVPTN